MRILVFAWDFPYPPRGGGRADVWRRIEAFIRLGHEVMLVNLYDPDGPRAPSRESLDHVDQVLAARYSFAIQRSPVRTLRQLPNLTRIPWHVANRIPDDLDRARITAQVDEFRPDLIWLDGPWFGELGLALRDRLGCRLAYRSHNIEHTYLLRQAAAAARLRDRVAWRLASVGLKHYQLKVMGAADAVFDISLNDMQYWQELGVHGVHWLPPLPELALRDPAPPTTRVPSDVLFVGGLRTPNNIAGVRWLVREVLPILRDRRPDAVVRVVGSYPHPELAEELAATAGVVTDYDVEDVTAFQFGARVLVNPVAVGSGVQLKMLDMLMTDAPIVTRTQGLAGLPDQCRNQFDIADTAPGFSEAILRRLDDPGVDHAAREAVRGLFNLDAVRTALSHVS